MMSTFQLLSLLIVVAVVVSGGVRRPKLNGQTNHSLYENVSYKTAPSFSAIFIVKRKWRWKAPEKQLHPALTPEDLRFEELHP